MAQEKCLAFVSHQPKDEERNDKQLHIHKQ